MMTKFLTVFVATVVHSCSLVTPETPLRIACIGDSITYGWGHADIAYPERLATFTGHEVVNFGVPGARVDDCAQSYLDNVQGQGFDVVVIMCGVNDVRQNPAEDPVDLAAVINGITGPERFIVLEILPFGGYSPWPFQEQTTAEFNAALDGAAPIYAEFGSLNDPWMLRDIETDDGLHLVDPGLYRLAQLVKAEL